MNVTLFIGNGFDIGLGLKTRYTDFYEYYKKLPSATPYIQEKKNDIAQNIELWSDLEAKLRNEAINLEGDEINDFLEFQDDLTDNLSEYLDKENRKTRFQDMVSKHVATEKILNGLEGITDKLNEMFEGLKKESGPACISNVLTFNYTFSFENMLGEEMTPFKIIHPHGDLKSTLVIGAYDIPYQMSQEFYDMYNFREVEKWMIKERIIGSTEELRDRYKAAMECIDGSDVICIFGMSLGDSDKIWWIKILEWLMGNEKHQLVIFSHSLNGLKESKSPRRQAVRRGEPIKERFVAYRGYMKPITMQNIMNKITVLPDSDRFNIKVTDAIFEERESVYREGATKLLGITDKMHP